MKFKKISEICEINPSKKFISDFSDGTLVSFVPMGSVSEDGVIDASKANKLKDVAKGYTYFKEGDILFAKITPCMENGKGGIAKSLKNGVGVGSTEFHIIRCNEAVNNEYINYLLRSKILRKKAELSMTGSAGQKRVPTSFFSNLKIPLPPLEEQKHIAAILDAADTLRQKDKALIAKYEALTQSLFLDMFGDPVTNPKGFDRNGLESLCRKITDGTHHSPPLVNEGVPYVTAKHVKEWGLDFYRNPTYVSVNHHNEIYKRCNPEYGDVLYIKDGATTGLACLNTMKEEISLLSSLALIKVDKKVLNNYYLIFFLNNERVKQELISIFMAGAAIRRYTLKKIKSFPILSPPITLQNEFAERVQEIEQQKELAQQSLVKSEDLFNSLLQRAFKGELTTATAPTPA